MYRAGNVRVYRASRRCACAEYVVYGFRGRDVRVLQWDVRRLADLFWNLLSWAHLKSKPMTGP